MKAPLFLLLTIAALHGAPSVSVTSPAPSATVGTLTSVSITFSEPVTGVLTGDFLINGEPAAAVSGSGAGPYVFTFPQPPAGIVTAGWDSEQVVSGIGTGQLVTPPAWTYTLTDSIAPVIGKLPTTATWTFGSPSSLQTGTGTQMEHLLPAPGSTVSALTQVEVGFAEAVTGVEAADLLVNGTPAAAVTGSLAGPYVFTFPAVAAGAVGFTWAGGHGIADLSGNAFAPSSGWSVTVGTPGTVQITEFLALNAGTSVMAGSATDGVRDENWDLSPWIELHNPGASSVELLGWSLTDDVTEPAKWIFPARTIAAGARLIVFASGKDRKPASGNLHTNFDLAANGGTLALFAPGATTPVSSWVNYPPQRYDYSYGALPADGTARYFSPPSVTQAAYTPPSSDGQTGTPVTGPAAPAGSANSTTALSGVLAEPTASVSRGFFNEPFAVILSGPAGATVRYTLDGSPPTVASTAYSAPVNVSATTVLRAAAFAASHVPSRTVTHTYLFPDLVCPSQPSPPYNHPGTAADDANPAPPAPGGSPLPIAWGTNSTFTAAASLPGFNTGTATGSNNLTSAIIPGLVAGKIPADYGMDIKVWADPTKYNDLGAVDNVNGVTNRQRIERALRTLPALSLVIKSTDFFGAYPNGQDAAATAGNPALPLYPNSAASVKTDMTKACSLEMLEPDGSTTFVVDAGIDLHGNASRDPFKNPKHGFTVRFKSKYGANNLEADLYPDSPVRKWDKLVLRGDFGGSWLHQSGADGITVSNDSQQRPRGIRIREAFSKESFRDMGRVASHHRFVNLFINGVCWGSYELMEDEAEDFTSSYMGGEKDQADVIDQKNDSVLNNRSASLKSGTWNVWSALKAHLGWTGGSATMDRNVPPTAAVLGYAWTNSQQETLKTMLDMPWFVDYMIWQTFAGHRDWANDNSDAARYMKNVYFVRPQGGKFRPMPWDMENLLWHESEDRVTGGTNSFNPAAPITAPSLAPPILIHPRIKSNAEYRMEFGDRAWRHMVKPGGALTPSENIARLDKWINVVGPDAICLESARWGDYRYKVHAYQSGTTSQVYSWNGAWYDNNAAAQYNGAWSAGIMKFNTGRTLASQLGTYSGIGMSNAWYDEIRRLKTIYFPARTSNVLAQYRTNGLYPFLNAPELRDNASNALLGDSTVAAGTLVKLTLPAAGTGSSTGEIYYTLDGTDPRPAYDQTGTPRAGALLYAAPFAITGPTTVKARLRGNSSAFPKKADVRAASIATAGAYTATGGASARGQITAAPATLDGIALAAGDRILMKNHATTAANGIYVVTTVGTGANGVWDRATDWDADGEVSGGTWVRVNAGLTNNAVSANEGSLWRVSNAGAITVGGASGTAVTFATQQFSPWSALMEITLNVGPLQPTVVISEINYNPRGSQGGTAAEFIEFYNYGTLPVDMTSWYMNGVEFIFPAATVLQPGQRLVIASNNSPATFAAQYPGVVVLGYFGGTLNNGGERLTVYDAAGRLVTSVEYDDDLPWPSAADNGGYSLELINPAGDLLSGINWRASTALKGSPGAANTTPAAPSVVISEFFAAGGQGHIGGKPQPDFIELHNVSGSPVDLIGWSLRSVPFTTSTVLPPDGRLVYYSTPLPVGGFNFGAEMRPEQGEFLLLDSGFNLVDAVRYGPQITTHSFYRDGNEWKAGLPTPGTASAPAFTQSAAQLRLNEVMSNPVPNPVPGEDDWLELYNGDTDDPILLTGLTFEVNGDLFTVELPALIQGDSYLRLWCDAGGLLGNNLNFNLPAEGTTLRIYDNAWTVAASQTYAAQPEGITHGYVDGTGWTQLAFPSPNLDNIPPATQRVRLNEVLVININGANTPRATREPWVELHNPLAAAVDLSGWSLRSVMAHLPSSTWTFANGTTIPAGGYLALWGRDIFMAFDTSEYDHHGIELRSADGQIQDRVTWGRQLQDKSIGRLVDGTWALLANPTRGAANSAAHSLSPAANVKLNEWQAAAPSGAHRGEFIELYNPGANPVALGGLWISDEPSEAGRRKTQIPALSFIAAGGHFVLSPEGEVNGDYPGGAPLWPFSYDFRISAGGEMLRLSQNDPATTGIDTVNFGPPSVTPQSTGRLTDGSGNITSLTASPGWPNASGPAPYFTRQPDDVVVTLNQPIWLPANVELATTFRWQRGSTFITAAAAPAPAIDALNNAGFSKASAGMDDDGLYTCHATSAAGTTVSHSVRVIVLHNWAAYAAHFGLTSQTGDNDSDGLSNATELLAGTNPLVPTSMSAGVLGGHETIAGTGYLTLEYTLSPRAAYTSFNGQRSSDLSLWSTATDATTQLLSTQSNGDQRLKVRFPWLPGDTREFVRLSVAP